MRATVRIDDHWEGSRRLGPARRAQRHADAPVSDDAERRMGLITGDSTKERISATSSSPRRTRARRIRRSARSDDHGDVGSAGGEVNTRLGGQTFGLAPRAAPDVDLRRVVLRHEQDVVAHIEDRRDLEPGRRDRLAVDRDPAGVFGLLDEDEATVGHPVRYARSRASASAPPCGRRASAFSPRKGRPRARPSASDHATGRAASVGTGRSTRRARGTGAHRGPSRRPPATPSSPSTERLPSALWVPPAGTGRHEAVRPGPRARRCATRAPGARRLAPRRSARRRETTSSRDGDPAPPRP